ncbi:MAG: hypothetical protein Q8S36_10940 [Sulfuricurvum sp.]|nr:hypothetical protein [Sulfuricurvum sp.]
MSSYSSSLSITNTSLTNINKIDSLLSGIKWGGVVGTETSLSYSFPWTSYASAYWQSSYSSYNEPYAAYHSGLSLNQITAVNGALQSWANIANVNFVQIAETNTEVGDFRFAFSSAVSDSWGWSYLPNDYWASSGDIWVNPINMNGDYSTSAYNYLSLIHEIGHSLGLKHPGNYNTSGTVAEGPFLPNDLDNTLYTVMSYNEPNVNAWLDVSRNSIVYIYEETPMVLDIAAMQYLYGANNSYMSGDTNYIFDNSMAPFMKTLWDAGGHDTISVASSSRSSFIDLTPGNYSNIQTNRIVDINEVKANNNTFNGYWWDLNKINPDGHASYNLGIAYGAIIEDAIGGSANDRIIGNSANNFLNGGAGDDHITGDVGNDRLQGGDGNDTLTGGDGADTAVYTVSHNDINYILNSNGTYTVTHGTMIDTLSEIEYLEFTDVTIDLVAATTGNHAQISTSGFENLTGSSFNNTLTGDSGNNILNGTLGADKMAGGSGNDTYIVDNLKDKVTEKTGEGIDTIQTTLATFSLAKVKEVENLTYTGASNATLTGSKSANNITGSTGNDTLDGGLGKDTLTGGAGNDTFKFTSKLSAANIDTISDFTSGDKIGLSSKMFKALGTTVTSDEIVMSTQEVTAKHAYIIYDALTHTLSYDADGSGTKSVAVAFAVLTGVDTLSASDFQIV